MAEVVSSAMDRLSEDGSRCAIQLSLDKPAHDSQREDAMLLHADHSSLAGDGRASVPGRRADAGAVPIMRVGYFQRAGPVTAVTALP